MITIIVPAYNCEEYIEESILSILYQTYSDWKLIVVDDGSLDRTGSICDIYRDDPRVRIVHNTHSGLSVSRNLGLSLSDTEWVMFVDADDTLSTTAIMDLLNAAEDADVVIGDYCRDISNMNSEEPYHLRRISSADAISQLFYDIHSRRRFGTAWGKIIKRDLVEAHPFPEGKLWEDVPVLYRIYHDASRISVIDDIVYYYRRNPSGITSKPFSSRNLDYMIFSEERLRFISKYYPDLLPNASSFMLSLLSDMKSKATTSGLEYNIIDNIIQCEQTLRHDGLL